MNLEKQYKEIEKQYKEIEKKEITLINSYENEILKKLENLETDYKYNIYYNILKDLIDYILITKKEYLKNKDYLDNNNFNYYCFNIELKKVYNHINNKNELNKKYNDQFNFKILENNDLYFIVYDLIKTDNENLFFKILETDLKDLDKIIYYIFSYILKGILNEYFNINYNNYLDFLKDFYNNIDLIIKQLIILETI